MAGISLFFRFLIDRRIVLEDELRGAGGICPAATELKDTFSSAEKAARTSAWLDSTFNGDFLPLINESIPSWNLEERELAYLGFYRRIEGLVGRTIFSHLHAILRGWRAVGGGFQQELDWGDFDFAHIPVGVLSQVYESFSHLADRRTARTLASTTRLAPSPTSWSMRRSWPSKRLLLLKYWTALAVRAFSSCWLTGGWSANAGCTMKSGPKRL